MPKLYIEDVYAPTNEEWDLIWGECDFSTYFHSREWAEIWHDYTKGKMYPCPKLILFSDGKEALIPLSVELSFKGLLKSYISSPAGTFGGWITNEKLKTGHANLIVNHLLHEYPNLFWRLNPYDKDIDKLGIKPNIADETYAIDLTSGFDAAYKKWRSQRRNRINHATKAGIFVRTANNFEDWSYYYDVLYKDSLRRWGKATAFYTKDFFEELYQRQSPYIKLWLAIYKNKIIAGSLYFYSKKHVGGWHSAALEKYLNTGMVHLLTYEAIKDACENGYSWFDLNPCGGHEGVRIFKKGLGTQELSCSVVNIETRQKKIINKIHRIYARKSIFKQIGGYLIE